MAKVAINVWIAASVSTNVRYVSDGTGTAFATPWTRLKLKSSPDLRRIVSMGLASKKSGSWFRVQYFKNPLFLNTSVSHDSGRVWCTRTSTSYQ